MSLFKPMLATDAELDKLRFPLLASAKLDGVRAVVRDGVVYSRSNKPIPNKHVQKLFGPLNYFDGELIVGEPTAHDVYRQTTSGVMSIDGEPDVKLYAFDHVADKSAPYRARKILLEVSHKEKKKNKLVELHKQFMIPSLYELLKLEENLLDEGYEGLILRDPDAPYKCGRSTVKEGYLLKLKRFTDAEFEVVGFEEQMHNTNEAKVNELGRTKRSSAKAGLVGKGTLGALILQHPDGFTFNCGTGFDDAERQRVWDNQRKFKGQLAKIKFFAVGMKTAPRHPVFLGWRDKRDI